MDLVPGLTADQIGALLQGTALLAGGVAFWFGLRQYSEAQAWKRHEFVASEVRQFNADPLARNAMLMIDWGTRRIELFPSHPEHVARYVLVTRPLLHLALVTHDKVGRPYTDTEAAIRDSFDAFFGGLERFEQFMQAGLVQPCEFQPYLAYWIRSICEDANPELRSLLNDYVAFYRFDSVGRLFRRYGQEIGQGQPSQASHVHELQKQYEELVTTGATSGKPT